MTKGLINLTAPWMGALGKERIKDDDARLKLTYPAAGAAGVLTGQMKAAPAFYRLDFKTCRSLMPRESTRCSNCSNTLLTSSASTSAP